MSVQAMRVAEPPGLVGGGGGGAGDVVGPASVNDGALAAFDGATGKLLRESGAATARDGSSVAKIQLAPASKLLLLARDTSIGWSGTTSAAGAPPTQISRLANGTVTIDTTTAGNGLGFLVVGGATCRGFTTSAGSPSTTEFPSDKDWGFHLDSALGELYLAFNNGGAVVAVLLS